MILIVFCSCMMKDKKQASDDKIVVRFWHPFTRDKAIGKTLLSLIDKFNKKHPKWMIKAENMGSYSILKQKLIASIIAGNQPEMSLAYESWISKFYKAKKLVCMDEMFKSKIELKKFKNNEISKAQLEEIIELRIGYHLNKAAKKMKKWML